MSKPQDITAELQAIAAGSVAALSSKLHADRAAALTDARSAIDKACARREAELKKAIAALQETRAAQLEAADATAEQTRRARAAALLAELHAPAVDSLASQVAAFRIEPGRAAAIAIRKMWDRFDERALAELGAPLHPTVLGAIFVDDVLNQPGLAGAVNALADPLFGGNSATIEALGAATRHNATPQAIEAALVQFESLILAVALRHTGSMPDPTQAGRHALKHAHATHRDLVTAIAAFDERQGQLALEHHKRTYVAPPSLAERFRAGLVERGLLPRDAAE